MDLMAHPFFGAVMHCRGRDFRFAFFLGALVAAVAMTAHGAPRPKTQADIVEALEKCANNATGTTRRATVKSTIHERTLCPSRPSFDFDHMRVQVHENLTTVECLCTGQPCMLHNDYRCTAVKHEFPVEYKNGTVANVTLTVACVCAKAVSGKAGTGPTRPS
ncbi:hypothetical protein MTO96_036697 [Rhipicephalus appendiculatus]